MDMYSKTAMNLDRKPNGHACKQPELNSPDTPDSIQKASFFMPLHLSVSNILLLSLSLSLSLSLIRARKISVFFFRERQYIIYIVYTIQVCGHDCRPASGGHSSNDRRGDAPCAAAAAVPAAVPVGGLYDRTKGKKGIRQPFRTHAIQGVCAGKAGRKPKSLTSRNK
jgi:hypothetical protein